MKEYLIQVGQSAKAEVLPLLHLVDPPTHVRLAVMAPLSNWGYPPNTVPQLLKISPLGLVIGLEANPQAPHDFVPWQNVAYVSDGTRLALELEKQKR